MTTEVTTKLQSDITEAVAAGFSGIWLRTFEPSEAMRELKAVCAEHGWILVSWDIDKGIDIDGVEMPDADPNDPKGPGSAQSPAGAIKFVMNQKFSGDEFGDNPDESPNVLLVLPNLHMYLHSRAVQEIQTIQNALVEGAAEGKHIVSLTTQVASVPTEIEKQMMVIEHQLPTSDELWEIARDLVEGNQPDDEDEEAVVVLPGEDSKEKRLILEAAAGFTRYEFSGAASLSIIRHNAIRPAEMWEMKEQMLKKAEILTMHRSKEGFGTLGGMNVVKDHLLEFFNSPNAHEPDVRAKGIILLGVQGTGKSELAKRLGYEVNRPTLILDVGKLMQSLVGQTEERTRMALQLADAMAPCILFVDEIEKALAGMGGGNDSGVGGRMLGTLLTWLNDHTSDVFFMGTSNDVSKLPGAFTRAERFDGIYFMDFPSEEGRDAIWDIYRNKFNIPKGDKKPDDTLWTGAEIKACCRLARLRNKSLKDAAIGVLPAHLVDREGIDKMRDWAKGRCLSADYEGSFQAEALQRIKPKVQKPSKSSGRTRRRLNTSTK